MPDERVIAEGQRGERPVAPSGQVRLRVLLVEDDPRVRALYGALLDLEGYWSEIVATAPEGIASIERNAPDIALVDLDLSGVDGCELARKVRTSSAGRGVFLAALTGFDDPEDRRRAREAGFDAYLVKSVNFKELLALLAEQDRQVRQPRVSAPTRRLPR
jgi:DNA-binding response OmpR family regulator